MDTQIQIQIFLVVSSIATGVFFAWIIYVIIKSRIEKRLTESSLRDSEKRFRKFLSSVTDVVYSYDYRRKSYDFISPSFESLTGYNLKELKTDPTGLWEKIVHPDDLQRLRAENNDLIQGKRNPESHFAEYRILQKGGQVIWVNERKEIEFNQQGLPDHVAGVITNITKRVQAELELKSHKDHLEEIVADRTSELEIRNEQLEKEVRARKKTEIALKESEKRFRILVSTIPDIVYEIDPEGYFLFINDSIKNLGYDPQDLIGKHFTEIIYERDVATVSRDSFLSNKDKGDSKWSIPRFFDERRTGSRRTTGLLLRVVRNNAVSPDPQTGEELVFCEINATGLYDGISSGGGRHFLGSVGIMHDISERIKAEKAIQESEQRYRELFDNMSNGVAVYTPLNQGEDFIIKEFNKAGERIHRVSKASLIGQSVLNALPGVKDFGLLETFRKVYNTGVPERNRDSFYRDERTVGWRETYIYKLPSGEIVSVFDDITERKQMETQLFHMATHDPLTGLPNRTLFYDRLTLAEANARRNKRGFMVMMIDVDYFKEINDNYGHGGGDKVLKVVGERLGKNLRKDDTVARIGGDEFVILVQTITDLKEAQKFADHISDCIREPLFIDDKELSISTSMGYALYPKDSNDTSDLIKQADAALYRVKSSGRNNHLHYDHSSDKT
ncbi:diguanylate cyclase [bacterium]|nr:diguanylate cyclase [bacterium]